MHLRNSVPVAQVVSTNPEHSSADFGFVPTYQVPLQDVDFLSFDYGLSVNSSQVKIR